MTIEQMIKVDCGNSPVVLAQPHGGTYMPEDVWKKLNDTGKRLTDTDWHINRLYDGLLDTATVVHNKVHRYAIDANRDPKGASLYPGQNTTSLCPITDFDGAPIYQTGKEPCVVEIESRRVAYHAPYHAALRQEIDRVRKLHGVVVLYDCHSIRSNIPYLFAGELPVFNIGTNDTTTCSLQMQQTVARVCADAESQVEAYRSVVNGRFKGGWTTRYYGKPETGVHAIQMELAQRMYMQENHPWDYAVEKADLLRSYLATLLHRIHAHAIKMVPPGMVKDSSF